MNTNTNSTSEETAENAETDTDTEDEKLLILPLNDKNSKKISQVISSDTARDILEAIASAPHSTSEIAEKLNIPLTTVQYNLEKLCDAGLVKVARTKYSKKMKPVKLYTPQRKLVVIVPEKTDKQDVIATLKRYLTVIAFAVVGSGAVELLARRQKMPALEEAARSIPEGGVPVPVPTPAPAPLPSQAPAPMYTPLETPLPESALDTIFGFDFSAHPGLWFLFGSLFIILVVVLLEYLGKKKSKAD